jgi:hypothetical protein
MNPVGAVSLRWVCTRWRSVGSCLRDRPSSRAKRAVESPFAIPRRRSTSVAGRWRVFSNAVAVSRVS